MAIEAAFLELSRAFNTLRDTLQSLGLTVVEDRPPQDEVLLVERLGNLVEDLRGWAEEGCASMEIAVRAAAHPPDLHAARHALGIANEHFILLEYRIVGEALAHRTIDGLLRFGHQRGREWLAWSKSVAQALDTCRAPLQALDEAFLQTWQELGERLGVRSMSLHATNIGQQLIPKQA